MKIGEQLRAQAEMAAKREGAVRPNGEDRPRGSMTPPTEVDPSPSSKLLNYPDRDGGGHRRRPDLAVAVHRGEIRQPGGTLTISIMITLGMLGATAYCLIYTIPTDDITPGVVGGLTAGFGAVVAYWLGRTGEGPPPPPPRRRRPKHLRA